MSEESSSDEEWCLSLKRTRTTKCWECDKYFRHIPDLMAHYRSHSLKATCHMCKITFRRETSLSTHLDNVHSPPICKKCCLCFTNAVELNKHAETNCAGQSFQEAPLLTLETPCFSQQQSGALNDVRLQEDTENPEKMEKYESFVEYSVEDSDSSETPDSGNEVETDDEYRLQSSSVDESSNSYSPRASENVHGAAIIEERPLLCDCCGEYFRSLEVHLRHCKAKTLYHCKMCKKFRSEESHSEHLRALYTCCVCWEVFFTKILYSLHKCPKDKNSHFIALFCSEAMPKSCTTCKTFFANKIALQNHITYIHTSAINKGCTLSNPPINSNSQGASGAAILVTNNTKTSPSSVNPGTNGESIDRSLILGQTAQTIAESGPISIPGMVCTASTFVNNRQDNVIFLENTPYAVPQGNMEQNAKKQLIIMQNNPQSQPQMFQKPLLFLQSSSTPFVPPLSPILLKPPAPSDTQQEGTSGPSSKQSQSCLSETDKTATSLPMPTVLSTFENGSCDKANLNDRQTHRTGHHLLPILPKPPAPADTQVKEDTCGPPDKQLQLCLLETEETSLFPLTPTVLAMFENDSREEAVMKHMKTNWRFKTCYPCRHCGAISRQLSLVISHRYLHRGRRSHLCQCGRAFKHRLHLLRHCVQHAEATGYICVSCGKSFIGSKQFARHLKKHRKRNVTEHSYCKPQQKCGMPFICDCGQLFFKPSAFIWHRLKNMSK